MMTVSLDRLACPTAPASATPISPGRFPRVVVVSFADEVTLEHAAVVEFEPPTHAEEDGGDESGEVAGEKTRVRVDSTAHRGDDVKGRSRRARLRRRGALRRCATGSDRRWRRTCLSARGAPARIEPTRPLSPRACGSSSGLPRARMLTPSKPSSVHSGPSDARGSNLSRSTRPARASRPSTRPPPGAPHLQRIPARGVAGRSLGETSGRRRF